MARLRCRCGEDMYTSEDPSPCIIDVYYEPEILQAISDDPDITLHNFMMEWDEKNDCEKIFMQRSEPVDYWFCPKCKRVYECQCMPVGLHWLRIFKRTEAPVPKEYSNWKRIVVITDTDRFNAIEEDEDMLLAVFMRWHDSPIYYISPDDTIVHALDKRSREVLFSYVLEDSWEPSSN